MSARSRRIVFAVGVVAILALRFGPRLIPQATSPRLVVLIVIDQMRADYFQRYAAQFTDGFKRLWESGAVFTEARYPYASNKTAQAHALMLSGWSPSATGIVGDRWYDRHTDSFVGVTAAPGHKLLGSAVEGASPEQMQVHTVGDALKEARPNAIVLTASWKRYTAVLNGGHHPDGAYWFDETTGHMATSDYYLKSYPAWTQPLTHDDLTLPYFGTTWQGHKLGEGSAPNEQFRARVRYSPANNSVLLAFAKALIERSGVGMDADPDLVAFSFSGLDYVGHEYGPETPEFDDTILKLDHDIGDLLRTLDVRVGAANYTVALTADHGAALLPEKQQARGVDAGRISAESVRAAVDTAVASKLGITGPIVAAFEAPDLYLNYRGVATQKITRQALDHAVVEALEAQPGIARAYTVDDIVMAAGAHDPLLDAVAEGYYADRSGDIHVMVKPNYIIWNAIGTTHGTPYEYDAHVPLIFMGAGVKPGRYEERVRINELAPTIGHLLGVPFKGDPKGRVLSEALR
jgi:hypothetical protein